MVRGKQLKTAPIETAGAVLFAEQTALEGVVMGQAKAERRAAREAENQFCDAPGMRWQSDVYTRAILPQRSAVI